MLKKRVIPCLLLRNESLVKTVKFDKYGYIGDPVNTARIFNELEVDELILLDILSSKNNSSPNFNILAELAIECFMPLTYGGGIKDFETVKRIFTLGYEKIALNSVIYRDTSLVQKITEHFGSQALIGSIDIKKNFWGKYEVYSHSGSVKQKKDPVEWACELEKLGVGELLITSIDKEGTWSGFDVDILKKISSSVNIPVIANGGAGEVKHIGQIIKATDISAVALGSMVVYQGNGLGVLVNFPDKKLLEKELN